MDRYSLILAGAIVLMIFLQLKRRSQLIIKARNTVVEKTSLSISFIMIAVVTLFGSSAPIHYLIGLLLAGLVYASFAKTGISRGGLHAMSRIFLSLPWRALRFAKIVRKNGEQEFELHSVGRVWTNVMTFDMKDFDRTVKLLKGVLKPDQLEIAREKPVKGLRDRSGAK